jgi:ribosomal protein S18 acetylase RimI-like enzyme
MIPRSFLAPDSVRLWRPASLDAIKEVSLLVSSAAPESPRALELATLGELAGGYRLFVRQSESASLLRRVFRARTASGGLRSWLRNRAFEEGYAESDAELRLLQLHDDLLENLRLESAIELHAFEATLGAVEQRFRDVGHLSKEKATEEAERVAVDPGAGSAALGRLLLRELEKEYLRLRPLSTPSEMEAAFLAEGQVPIRLLRLKLLGLNPS